MGRRGVNIAGGKAANRAALVLHSPHECTPQTGVAPEEKESVSPTTDLEFTKGAR